MKRYAPASRRPRWQGITSLLLLLVALGCAGSWLQEIRTVWRKRMSLAVSPHRVALLEQGRGALRHRLALVRSARHSIRVQTFIWSDDPVAEAFLGELLDAAERGVLVQVLGDGMFTHDAARTALAAATRNANFRARLYRPAPAPSISGAPYLLGKAIVDWRGLHQRMHNKVMTVDDRVGIVGGRNIADEYYDRDPDFNFLDLDIVVDGPVVKEMTASFADYWKYSSPLTLPSGGGPAAGRGVDEAETLGSERVPSADAGPPPPAPLRWWDVEEVGFWADPPGKPEPDRHGSSLALRLAALLSEAEEEVLIQSPYLILSPRAQELFAYLNRKDVALRVSTNSLAATDNWLTYAHSLRQRRTILRDLGFEMREMKPYPADLKRYIADYDELRARRGRDAPLGPSLSLHSKALVIDRHLALVGSYNLTPRSATLDTEAGVVVRDPEFANAMAEKIDRDMAADNSWTVAKKQRLLPVAVVDGLLQEVNDVTRSVTTLDVWPLRYSTLFEIKPGRHPLPPDDPRFYEDYRDVGLFPGVHPLGMKRILVELTRMLSGAIEPLL